jgi:Zn-dependent protease with chaperone function
VWRGCTGFVLRALGVRIADDAELARAENLVDGLCASMGVELPDIVLLDDDTRQALALGRTSRTGVLVVTTGLVRTLDPVHLEAVLAHELVHVKRADIAPATVAAAVCLPLATVFPVSGLVHSLAGRGREMHTDTLAVSVTRYPPGLREALVLMAEGPSPGPSSALARRAVARTTRWLWTVPLHETAEAAPAGDELIGDLDAPEVRVAALDEA